MNPAFVDPDTKINMSLDEIIQLSRGQTSNELPGRRTRRKKKRSRKIIDDGCSHSVPLLSSPNGVGIYVSRKSSLLIPEHRRWITRAISNRAMNCDLIKKSKVIIPAEYKLFRTDQGVERILVPAQEHFTRPKEKLSPPRKLNKTCDKSTPDEPPPLVNAPIYSPPPRKTENDISMDVDGPEDGIVIMDIPEPKKLLGVIDLECDLPVDVLESKRLFVTAPSLRDNSIVKTLSERFTMLTGSFQF